MAGSASVISVSNQALGLAGARASIANFNEGNPESNACALWFEPTFTMLARTAYWGCLRAQATLSLLAAATGTPENPDGTTLPLPPTPWLYQYAYPLSCLAVRFIVPSNPATTGGTPPTGGSIASPYYIPNGGKIPFAIASSLDNFNNPINTILTNQSMAQVVYTINQQEPSLWDSQFQMGFVASFAAFLVPVINMNLQLMQISIKTAESIIMQARAADGNEGVTVMDHVPDYIRARAGATGYGCYGPGYGWNGACYGDYGSMSWPNYG